MIASKTTSLVLLISIGLTIQLCGSQILRHGELLRVTRQASSRAQAGATGSVSSPVALPKASIVLEPSQPTASVSGSVSAQRPKIDANPVSPRPTVDVDGEAGLDEPDVTTKRPNRRRRPPTRRPTPARDYDDSEYCDDDYYEHPDMNPFGHPMRQIGSMMNMMMNKFGDLGFNPSGSFGGDSPLVAASSSAYSDGDGYSRTYSSVNNNGKIRGLISETRDGRTSTRRIGRRDYEDDSNDEYY